MDFKIQHLTLYLILVSDASDVDTDNEGVGNDDDDEEEEEDSSDGDQDENGAESENGSFIPPSEDVSVSELLDKAESIKSDTKVGIILKQ